jgi:hypothetical protein
VIDLPICTRGRVADEGQAHLMTVFQGAVDATFAGFDIDATYTRRVPSRCG